MHQSDQVSCFVASNHITVFQIDNKTGFSIMCLVNPTLALICGRSRPMASWLGNFSIHGLFPCLVDLVRSILLNQSVCRFNYIDNIG